MAVPLVRTSERGDYRVPLGRPRGYGPRRTEEERLAAIRGNRQRIKLKKLYGITAEQFNAMYDRQKGRCAICNEPFRKRPDVDHCHETNVVRGLLCRRCNVGLGWFDRHEDAIQVYLYEEE